MSKVYACPECFGHYDGYRFVRVRRWDGDTIERWPNPCWLCNEGVVTLDQIVERANAPLEYITRLLEPQAVMTADTSSDAETIPF